MITTSWLKSGYDVADPEAGPAAQASMLVERVRHAKLPFPVPQVIDGGYGG
jgi:hypothetical protein